MTPEALQTHLFEALQFCKQVQYMPQKGAK